MKLTNSSGLEKQKLLGKVTKLRNIIKQAASQSTTSPIVVSNIQRNSSKNNINLKVPKKKIKSTKDKENCYDNCQNKNSNNHMISSVNSSRVNFILNNLQGQDINPHFSAIKKIETSSSNRMIASVEVKPRMYESLEACKLFKDFNKKKYSWSSKDSITALSIDDFSLGKKIGKGRFGNVYIAQQRTTKFILAIKIINKQQLKQSGMEDQLISEIKIQTYMKHPNILKMYGYFSDKKNIYLLIQLAEDTLFNKVIKQYGLQEKKAAYYTKQVLEALKYMHCEAIIHRDIKPENIMLINGVIKIGDFGWSVYAPLYKRQTFCGTLEYVSPQVAQGDFYDQRSDIWSLGILIYELNMSRAPFQSEKQSETLQEIVTGQIDFPPNLSPELIELLKAILKKKPKERLSLIEIDKSQWLRAYEKQGRFVCGDIWSFWNP